MRKRVWQILLLHFAMHAGIRAQDCVGDFFAIDYATGTAQKATSAILTPQNDILLLGSVLKPNSTQTDGWITKLSPQGNVIWSRKYSVSELVYRSLHFTKAIPDGENTFVVIGSIGIESANHSPATLTNSSTLMLRVDINGEVRDASRNYSGQFNDVTGTRDGGLILTFNNWEDSTAGLIKITGRTPIEWQCRFRWPNEPAKVGRMHTLSLSGDRIMIASAIRLFDVNNSSLVTRQGYFLACINGLSGALEWQRMFTYTGDPANSMAAFGDVSHVTELPNGDLSVIASYAASKQNSFRETNKLVNLITDNAGNLKNVKAYTGPQQVYTTSAVPGKGQGECVLLLDNGESPYLLELNASGEIEMQNSYPLIGTGQESRTLLSTVNGHYFFSYAHNGDRTHLKLIKTDGDGNAGCIEQPASFIMEDATADFRTEPINSDHVMTRGSWARLNSVLSAPYNSLASQIICRNEKITRIPIAVCDADSYTLPTNEVITESGTYTANYTTPGGCDSIVHYIATFAKNPRAVLGEDECLDGKDSVILRASGGNGSFNWMGINSPDSSIVVKQPGTYFVSVTNVCGTSVDSAAVYQQCEFDIHVPNAFTPNGDYNNDNFGVPKLNKNRFVNLKIFNRWGQIVFESNKKDIRWDGNIKGHKAPMGAYVYLLTMQTLNGKRKVQKGLINLIR